MKLLTVLLGMMALTFIPYSSASLVVGAGTGDAVNYTVVTAQQNLTAFTFVVYAKPTTITANNVLVSTHSALNADQTQVRTTVTSPTNSNWTFRGPPATTTAGRYDSGTPDLIHLGDWQMYAVSFNGSDARIYAGNLTDTVVEAGVYTTVITMVGGRSQSESGITYANRATPGRFQGSIAIGMYYNRNLSLGDLRTIQYTPRCISGCVQFTEFGWNGTGGQTDWSGVGTPGINNGGTLGSHTPLATRFRR